MFFLTKPVQQLRQKLLTHILANQKQDFKIFVDLEQQNLMRNILKFGPNTDPLQIQVMLFTLAYSILL